jgi:HK97 gp10 family phage protein
MSGVYDNLITHYKKNLVKAGQYLQRKLRANLNTPYPPASSPGEMPHRRTGELRDSMDVFTSSDGLAVRVTTEHAGYLEYGTANMAARPFFQRTIDQEQKQVMKILRGQ